MEIMFNVLGELPPSKGEAKSMLADGHAQATRVRRLLEEAATAMAGRELLSGAIGLELLVSVPPGRRVADATNMLGGVGDVLQARSTGADTTHLGELADVACYSDDNQIHEITYKSVPAPTLGYRVRLWTLDA